MRVFLAVDFTDRVRNEIQASIDAMGIPNPPWRWVSIANLHVTLKFLGETPEDRVQAICQCAEEVCGSVNVFRIRLGRLGAFPNLSHPRVLFFRAEEGVAELKHLAGVLDTALSRRLGLSREKRPFRAHATIARIKTPLPPATVERLKTAPPLARASQEVATVTLAKSDLRPKGPIYHHLKGFALLKSKC